MGDPKYADFTWPARWNKAPAAAFLSQSGPDVMAVNFMGTLRFRLDDTESVDAIVSRARQFAMMVESAKRAFDGVCDRCGKGPAPRWTSEICRTCDPVRLCQPCFDAHAAEAAADVADGLAQP